MSAGQTPPGAKPRGANEHELALYATLRRRLLLVTAAIGVLAIGLGWALRGLPGLWGALLATGIGVAFMATTVIVVGWCARRSPQLLMAAMLGSWLGKMVLAFVAVVVIRPLTFYDKTVFLLALAAVVLGGLAVESVTALRAREAYSIDPS